MSYISFGDYIKPQVINGKKVASAFLPRGRFDLLTPQRLTLIIHVMTCICTFLLQVTSYPVFCLRIRIMVHIATYEQTTIAHKAIYDQTTWIIIWLLGHTHDHVTADLTNDLRPYYVPDNWSRDLQPDHVTRQYVISRDVWPHQVTDDLSCYTM